MLVALVCVGLASLASGMKPARLAELRHDTVDMFYHGFDNYMNVAFPEDEVCGSRSTLLVSFSDPMCSLHQSHASR